MAVQVLSPRSQSPQAPAANSPQLAAILAALAARFGSNPPNGQRQIPQGPGVAANAPPVGARGLQALAPGQPPVGPVAGPPAAMSPRPMTPPPMPPRPGMVVNPPIPQRPMTPPPRPMGPGMAVNPPMQQRPGDYQDRVLAAALAARQAMNRPITPQLSPRLPGRPRASPPSFGR